MKLLIVSHACVTPINQSFFADLEEEMGWRITLALPSTWRTEYQLRSGTERWPTLKAKMIPLDIWLQGDIPRHIYRNLFIGLLRDERPDAIYVHHEPYAFATAQIYLANRLAGNRPIGFYAAQNILKRYPIPVRQMESWILKQSSFAFPVTQGALDVLRAKQYRQRAEVLPLAINAAIYKPAPAWSSQKRAELGIGDRFVIGYLGRFVKEKGLGTLLTALQGLTELPWELILIGSGPFEEELRKMVASMGDVANRVRILGYVPHVEAPNWLSMFDVLVLPSETRDNWKEQFGRVLVEAMACRTPVIGSDSGEIPAVINDTGGGLVFPEGDAGALRKSLEVLGKSPELRSSLANDGMKSVVRLYDQRFLVRRFASTIEDAIRQPAP